MSPSDSRAHRSFDVGPSLLMAATAFIATFAFCHPSTSALPSILDSHLQHEQTLHMEPAGSSYRSRQALCGEAASSAPPGGPNCSRKECCDDQERVIVPSFRLSVEIFVEWEGVKSHQDTQERKVSSTINRDFSADRRASTITAKCTLAFMTFTSLIARESMVSVRNTQKRTAQKHEKAATTTTDEKHMSKGTARRQQLHRQLQCNNIELLCAHHDNHQKSAIKSSWSITLSWNHVGSLKKPKKDLLDNMRELATREYRHMKKTKTLCGTSGKMMVED